MQTNINYLNTSAMTRGIIDKKKINFTINIPRSLVLHISLSFSILIFCMKMLESRQTKKKPKARQHAVA